MLALVLFAAALLSKTVVVTLPAVILVIYWWKRGALRRGDVLPLVPFFLLALLSGWLGLWLEKHHVRAAGTEWALTPAERLLVAGRSLWFHAGKLVWPHPLMFFYPRWAVDSATPWQYLFPLAAVTVPLALGPDAGALVAVLWRPF